MKCITCISVRKEGDVNQAWLFEYSDGSEDSYYAYEGSPQSSVDDRRVYDYDPKLGVLLQLLDDMTPAPKHDDWSIDIELDINLNITKVTHQGPED